VNTGEHPELTPDQIAARQRLLAEIRAKREELRRSGRLGSMVDEMLAYRPHLNMSREELRKFLEEIDQEQLDGSAPDPKDCLPGDHTRARA